VFFSACGESYVALFARLYEYDHKNKKLIRHMALEDKILMSQSALRTSKLHTAMSFIGGGRILTTTHTTSPGPKHPTWMPYEYADHPYEGYQGSNLIMYNYLTGETKGLGVISPHDTTYGGCYDPKNGDYIVITWMRGVGYVYNIHTGEYRCLGQISDSHTSRLFLCSDGHIYGSTYSGAMFRYNTDIRDIEFLGVDAPGLIRHARELNGILYFTTGPCSVPGRGQDLYAYNLKTREITNIGRPVPKAEPVKSEPVKAEAPKAEPVKSEPVKTEVPKAEPAKKEPIKAEAPKAEPVKSEPVKAEAPKAETAAPAEKTAQTNVKEDGNKVTMTKEQNTKPAETGDGQYHSFKTGTCSGKTTGLLWKIK